jgi:hypothetical protein
MPYHRYDVTRKTVSQANSVPRMRILCGCELRTAFRTNKEEIPTPLQVTINLIASLARFFHQRAARSNNPRAQPLGQISSSRHVMGAISSSFDQWCIRVRAILGKVKVNGHHHAASRYNGVPMNETVWIPGPLPAWGNPTAHRRSMLQEHSGEGNTSWLRWSDAMQCDVLVEFSSSQRFHFIHLGSSPWPIWGLYDHLDMPILCINVRLCPKSWNTTSLH